MNKNNVDFIVALGEEDNWKCWHNEVYSFDHFCEDIHFFLIADTSLMSDITYTKGEFGGYMGGSVIKDNGPRTLANIKNRTLWTADLDNLTPEMMNYIEEKIPFMSVIHSTHNHTPEKPRLRIIAPFNRPVTVDEYKIIATYLNKTFGDGVCDDTSTSANQFMFWPTHPENYTPFYKETDGDPINANEILRLAKVGNPANILKTKESPQESTAPIESPLTEAIIPEDGVIGAFCHKYPIKSAIDMFLKNVYTPTSDPNRYTYIAGTGEAGLVIVNDIAFCHHASDPASKKKSLNSFDLVCLHLFNDDPQKMITRLLKEDWMKKQLIKDKMAKEKYTLKDDDWVLDLEFTKNGKIADTQKNVEKIIEHDPRLQNFKYNTLARHMEVVGNVPWKKDMEEPWWTDDDSSGLRGLLHSNYTTFSTENLMNAFNVTKLNRRFNPIKDYLDSLPEWDGVKRVETLLIDTMNAEDNEYVRAATRKTLIAAVARTYHPGIKYDNLLVLDGMQGIGKSTLFRDLAGEEYYSDSLSLTDMIDKTAAEKLQGNWIVEVAELSGMRKADIEKVKSFFSSTDDKYRPPYAREVESHKRKCIIIATVNGDMGYLRDITGNRRFWPIKLHQDKQGYSSKYAKENRDQIWAEAKYYYQQKEQLHLEDELLDMAEKAQMEALETDDNLGIIEDYLNTLIPEYWNDLSIQERQQYINGEKPLLYRYGPGTIQRNKVCAQEIWCECLGNPKGRLPQKDSRKITTSLLKLGWKASPSQERMGVYGKQRLFVRPKVEQT